MCLSRGSTVSEESHASLSARRLCILSRHHYILIKRFKRKADVDTFEFYLITRPERIKCPEIITGSSVDINGLLLRADEHIFLNRRATLVVSKLFSSVGRLS